MEALLSYSSLDTPVNLSRPYSRQAVRARAPAVLANNRGLAPTGKFTDIIVAKYKRRPITKTPPKVYVIPRSAAGSKGDPGFRVPNFDTPGRCAHRLASPEMYVNLPLAH